MKLRNLATCLLLVGGLSASCIREDNSDCYNIYRLAFSYKGDGTKEIFSEKINRVDLYVFDQNSNCVSSTRLSDSEVEAQLTTLPPLEPGDYRIVCVGNAHETKVENLESKDLGKVTFAAEDYINGETVSGNDSLYWSAIDYTIEPFSPYVTEETRTTSFASSHYDIIVEVFNAPENIGKHPKIEIVGVSPQTDFHNAAKGQQTNYIMNTVHDGMKTTTAVNNIMRHKNHEDVYLKITGEDGTEAVMISFAEHIRNNSKYINTDLHECVIPFRIEFEDPAPPVPDPPTPDPPTPDPPVEDEVIDVNVKITLPTWFITLVTPQF